MAKKKILVLSDHALSTSGVGVQSRFLIEGLIATDRWTVRQFGAALKHTDYSTVVVNDDFIIKPIDGFGSPDLIRIALATEKPDVLLIFTDPRFFIWLWEMEDEIHQQCPIAYWHVWDNRPTPRYNDVLYESTDLISCHSYLTYEMVSENFPDKTKFIPHALPPDMYYPLSKTEISNHKIKILGPERSDHFVVFWVNRNAKRKRPNDLLWSWKMFLDDLEKKHGHKNATLLIHSDPMDSEGPNMLATTEMLGLVPNVVFSTDRIDFDHMNIMHNVSDVCVNISYAEGFGLGTLEAMNCGNPIIAPTTGGLTRQVIDHRDGSEHGVALPIEFRSLVGSQGVPYIYEDYVSAETIANAYMKLYELTPEERSALSKKCREYALSEFAFDKTINLWDQALIDLVENWRDKYDPWICKTL
jgi:glycosyltransferase involved in cell wall biosynthesis